jgi:HK97 family phage portal protein
VSILDRLLPWRQKSMSTLELFREIYGGKLAASGRNITLETAIQVSTVVACMRVISEGIAQVPLKVMREANGKRLPARDHPLYDVLAVRPNWYQTSFEFREMLGWHVGLTGNHYSFKNVIGQKVRELIPLDPCRTKTVRADDGELSYEFTAPSGSKTVFTADQIWHVRGPSWNGWAGLEAIQIAREAIGLAMATEEQHSRMHRNGVRNSGVYSVEGTLNKQQHKDLVEWIQKEMAGLENASKPMILDRNAKWLSTAMTGVDAQHLETRKYQVEEICRFMRVMPIMVGYSDKAATYASAEQMFLAHVVHTLAPWYQRLEQSIDANLLTKAERNAGYYSKFVEEGLLRGSIEATANVLDKYVNGGMMTPNEGRAKLDMNPDPDPASDKLRVPANIVGKQPQGEPK